MGACWRSLLAWTMTSASAFWSNFLPFPLTDQRLALFCCTSTNKLYFWKCQTVNCLGVCEPAKPSKSIFRQKNWLSHSTAVRGNLFTLRRLALALLVQTSKKNLFPKIFKFVKNFFCSSNFFFKKNLKSGLKKINIDISKYLNNYLGP